MLFQNTPGGDAMVKMTIFKTSLNAQQLKNLFLDRSDHLLDNRYVIAEDKYGMGFFLIFDPRFPNETYSFGIKKDSIWTIQLPLTIEEMLKKKSISFSKMHCDFETEEEANEIFSQEYLM